MAAKKKRNGPRLLTIKEANKLARGKVIVRPDALNPRDTSVWYVSDGNDVGSEIQYPMTRRRWLAFLKTWVEES